MSYRFGSKLYKTKDNMLSAIAEEFISAEGVHTKEEIREILETNSSLELAQEAIEEWQLDEDDNFGVYDLADSMTELMYKYSIK